MKCSDIILKVLNQNTSQTHTNTHITHDIVADACTATSASVRVVGEGWGGVEEAVGRKGYENYT